jgi:hypothetical protein
MIIQLIILLSLTIFFLNLQSLFFDTKVVNYINRFWLTSLFYLFFGLIIFLIFYEFLKDFLSEYYQLPLTVAIIFGGICLILFSFVRSKYGNIIAKIYAINNKQKIITFDNRLLFSKSCQIALQQLLILSLISIFYNFHFDKSIIVFICGNIFAIAHIYGLIKWGKVFGSYLLICSFILGFISSALILNVPYGFVYSFIIHWLFYIISTLLVIKYHDRKILRKYILRFILQV